MGRFLSGIPYAALLLEVLIFHRLALFTRVYGIPWDLRGYHVPIASFVAESLSRGELPLWDPWVYCGRPLYANLTAQVFYPPAWLFHGLNVLTGNQYVFGFLQWQQISHIFLGGMFTFWLLRAVGMEAAAALFGASIFELGGFFASQAQHLGAVNAAAWMPLAWLAQWKMRGSFTWKWFGVLAGALAMSILAGFPAVTVVVFGSNLLLGLLWRKREMALGVAFAMVVAVLLSAVQVLPTMELTRLSVARFRSEFMGTGGGMPVESLVSLVWPNYYGIFDLQTYKQPYELTYMYAYCGIVGLAAALVGFWRKAARPFAVVLGVSVVWMLGDKTPVVRSVFPYLPDAVKSSMYLEFALALFCLSMAVVAAYGVSLLPAKWQWVMTGVVAVDLIAVGSGRPMNTERRDPGSIVTREAFEGSKEFLDTVRKLVNESVPPWRIDTMGDSMDWAMAPPLIHVPNAGGNDPFALATVMQARRMFTGGERWGRYYEVKDWRSEMLDWMSVRYLFRRERLAEAEGLKELGVMHYRVVYENPDALPRFFLTNELNSKERLGTVTVREYAAQRVELETEAPKRALLMTSEAWYPGWEAQIDGKAVPMMKTHIAFRALPMPEGKHTVTMVFRPRVLLWGALVTLLGIAWLVLMVRRPT